MRLNILPSISRRLKHIIAVLVQSPQQVGKWHRAINASIITSTGRKNRIYFLKAMIMKNSSSNKWKSYAGISITILLCLFIVRSCFSLDMTIWNKPLTDLKITLLPVTGTMYTTDSKTCVKRIPDVLIVGASKCGTGALSQFLSYHPGIVIDAVAELNFFGKNYGLGYDWYLENLPCSRSDQVLIERTAAYMYRTEVIERVWDMRPSTKIIMCVCEPVRRTISEFVMKLGMKLITDTNITHSLIKGNKINADWYVLKQSNYSLHFSLWLRRFPFQQIHIVDGDRLKVEPWKELTNTEDFLGVKHEFSQNNFSFNKTKGFYCFKRNNAETEECLDKSKGRPHPEVKEEIKAKLRAFYKHDNEVFFKQIRKTKQFKW